jgi:hypothetical protein
MNLHFQCARSCVYVCVGGLSRTFIFNVHVVARARNDSYKHVWFFAVCELRTCPSTEREARTDGGAGGGGGRWGGGGWRGGGTM